MIGTDGTIGITSNGVCLIMIRTRPRFSFVLLLASLCLALYGGTAFAQDSGEEEKEQRPFFLSPTASLYMPTDGKTKDAFGKTWSGFGVAINTAAFGWEKPGFEVAGVVLTPFIGYYHADRRDNDAHIIPVGLETRWTLADNGSFQPYAGLGLSVSAVKFDDHDAGVKTGWKAAAGGRFVLGADIGRWLNIQAAYNLMDDVENYDFSGFSIGAKISFYF